MTIPYERYQSVRQTERFLLDLCNPKITPRVPIVVREQARSLLTHYPGEYHMNQAAQSLPNMFDKNPWMNRDNQYTEDE